MDTREGFDRLFKCFTYLHAMLSFMALTAPCTMLYPHAPTDTLWLTDRPSGMESKFNAFVHQIFSEYLLCTRHCASSWGEIWARCNLCPLGIYHPVIENPRNCPLKCSDYKTFSHSDIFTRQTQVDCRGEVLKKNSCERPDKVHKIKKGKCYFRLMY